MNLFEVGDKFVATNKLIYSVTGVSGDGIWIANFCGCRSYMSNHELSTLLCEGFFRWAYEHIRGR